MSFVIRFKEYDSEQKDVGFFCEMGSFVFSQFENFWSFISIILCLVSVYLDSRINLVFNPLCRENIDFDAPVAHETELRRGDFE